MELGLSLGEAPMRMPPPSPPPPAPENVMTGLGLGFCMGLGFGLDAEKQQRCSADPPPQQLELLPLRPISRHTWSHETRHTTETATCGFDVNRAPSPEESEEGAPAASPNSLGDAGGSRGSDEDDNGGLSSARKKLRLTKEQSAFLEENFKEHHTLNPRQKGALAKQLGLRPRQVEVWFQNRRARTKLKQTEVDCEYLKRCCETLTKENRRLHKELVDLRALKTASPYYMHLPATTLSMCPSCERVSTASAAGADAGGGASERGKDKQGSFAGMLARPRFFPFGAHSAAPATHQPSAAS